MSEKNLTANEANLEKFNKVHSFFCDLVEDEGGEVSHIVSSGEDLHAVVHAKIECVDLRGEGMKRFLDVLQYVDKLDIKATSDYLLIDAQVNDVWEAV